MTVDSTHTLEQQIHWCHVGNHRVEVQIQGLLHHLGRHHHTPGRPRAIGPPGLRPQIRDEFALLPNPVRGDKTGMQQANVLSLQVFTGQGVGMLGPRNGVAQNQ
ncbi:hypothetical protein M3876_06205 [Rothia kristinae]|nr:hypothetical protein [Rothia kristinae]MCT2243687.1 hypothetical protein [Rothia kristinae]